MSCLNPEIFLELGRQLIEEGNPEDVYKFALSGEEPLQAMKRIFSSVTTLKLDSTNFEIGWGEKCCKFNIESDKPHLKFLMHQIGSSVKKLGINCEASYLHQIYQPIIDKIVEKKQLIDFSVDPLCSKLFVDKFVPVFATSLKHVAIPNEYLTLAFRDSLCLESLTIRNPCDPDFALFCCKTFSLRLIHIKNNYEPDNLLTGFPLSPTLSSVKELTIESSSEYFDFDQFEKVIEYFPALESINYKITPNPPSEKFMMFTEHICFRIRNLMKTINRAVKVPPKITCLFLKSEKQTRTSFFSRRFYYRDFEDVKSVKELQCFQKKLSTADNESILFEIHFVI